MAMRNGIIADTLRSTGLPYRIIFGLNLPQLEEIAKSTGTDRELSDALRTNVTTRESLLLAPMIFPFNELTPALASEMIENAPSAEVIDILAHYLLRKTPFAESIIDRYAADSIDLRRYAAIRLLAATWRTMPVKAASLARNETLRQCALTRIAAMNIIDDIKFSNESAG